MIIDLSLLKHMGDAINKLDEHFYEYEQYYENDELIDQKSMFVEIVEQWIANKEYELKKERNGKTE